MRKNYFRLMVLSLALASLAWQVNAQEKRYVYVSPGIGTLNDSISKDTLTNGARVDSFNTVYVLERGNEAYYGLTGSISNSGYPLTIMAEEGDGARPFLQPRVVEGESSRAFRPRGNITLMGLHVTNMDDLGGLATRMLRCSEDNIKIVADDCWFDKDGQSFIRTDNPGQSYFITNSVISNIGQPGDPNNGRGIDDRGNDIDTVWFENCTFYNITSRIIRDDGGVIKYAYMNNNTIVNIGQMGITFGPIEELVMTNNLGRNVGFMPKDDDSDWFVFSADSTGGMAPVVTVANNATWLESEHLEPYLNDTTTVTPFMNPTMQTAVFMSGTALTNKELDVMFNDGPPFNDSMLVYHYSGEFDPIDAPAWAEPDPPAENPAGYHWEVPYDFGYANTEAYEGATDGMQLGDRNWTATYSTGVEPRASESGELSIYPVPVRDQVTVSFNLDRSSDVSVELYNMVGSVVARVEKGRYAAGSHSFQWNVAGQVEPGLYILRMNAGSSSRTAKLVVE